MTRGEILLRRELKREMGSTEPLIEEEIIEEPKKIEKMECSVESWFTPSQVDIEIIKKINELIDEINNLKEKKDD